jgi:gamma-tubulin complex component 3
MSAPKTGTAPGRSRRERVDDALSQLVDSILPSLSVSDLEDEYSASEEDALAAADERRHRDRLDRAWNTIETPPDVNGDGGGFASSSSAENINNASDLIKRKLLRENASPDKAVRFSNLYSRLLTQPLLSQKWAILYLLYQLSESNDEEDDGGGNIALGVGGERRTRSPLMEEGNLENILLRGSRNSRLTSRLEEDDEGPAISSSVSQRGGRVERSSVSQKMAAELQKRRALATDRRESVPSRTRAETPATETAPTVNQADASKDAQGAINAPSESALLQDLPFILQGLSSTNAEFTSASTLKLPPSLPVPVISLLHTLAEPCLLYKSLSAFVEETEGGLVSQALRAAVGNELRSYLSLVATLEGEIRRAMTAVSDQKDPKASLKGAVTLKRCVVWTRDATMALRLMSLIVEEAQRELPSY